MKRKANAIEIANKMFEEMKDDNEIISAVLSDRYLNTQLIASVSVDGISYEVWKQKEGKLDVIKSSMQPSDKDFKVRVSTKKMKNDILKEIIGSITKAFDTTIGDFINANKQDSPKQ